MDRWATFDCYGTLVDWRGGIGRELARLFGAEREPELLDLYYRLEPEAQGGQALPYREVLARTLAAVAAAAGTTVPPGEEDILARSLPSWPVFPDVRDALTEARARGWRLAILSNTDRDLIEASLTSLGVLFDLALVASEVGAYKPAHRHWDVFAEITGATPAEHVHVAQSLFHDIGPADALGLRSVWINRLGETPGPQPTRELAGLSGLADTLDGLVPAL